MLHYRGRIDREAKFASPEYCRSRQNTSGGPWQFNSNGNDAARQSRETYSAPRLTEHGPVEKLTGNVGTTGSDGLTGSTLP